MMITNTVNHFCGFKQFCFVFSQLVKAGSSKLEGFKKFCFVLFFSQLVKAGSSNGGFRNSVLDLCILVS